MTVKKLVEEHFAAVSIFSFVFFIVIPIFLYANIKGGNDSEAVKTTNRVAVCNIKSNPTYEWEAGTSHGYTHTTYYAPISATNPSSQTQPLAYRRTVYPDYYVNGIPVIDDTVSYRNSNYQNYYIPTYYNQQYPSGYTQYPDPYYYNQNYYGSNYYPSQNYYGGTNHPTVYATNSYQGNSW